MRQLVSLGVVDREQYRVLSDGYRARSAVAHGFQAPDEIGSTVRALLDISDGLRKTRPA